MQNLLLLSPKHHAGQNPKSVNYSSASFHLLQFFSLSKKERSIADRIESLLVIAHKQAEKYTELVSYFAEGNHSAYSTTRNEILSLERQIDSDHRSLRVEVAQGTFFGGIRDNMITIIGQIDRLAKKTKEASSFLSFEGIEGEIVPSLLRSDDMIRLNRALLGSVATMESMVKSLRISRQSILNQIDLMKEHQEVADHYKRNLLTSLFANRHGINAISLIQLGDLIRATYSIVDAAEEMAESMIILVAKGYV